MEVSLLLAFILRMAFLLYGTYHDEFVEVKYTDIDYTVFSDAARHVTKGNSPYLKDTYKYTPMLAYLLTPNIYFHMCFGKVLFCVVDILIAVILRSILNGFTKVSDKQCTILVSVCWLYNPFTVTISSRGNAESIQIFLVLATLFCAMKYKLVFAAVFYGLSVHFKLYPVIYVVPLLLFIGQPNHKVQSMTVHKYISVIMNTKTLQFGCISFLTFFGAGCLMFQRYGFEFIHNTYLFHLHRKDFQHNFSSFFYILRLLKDSPWLHIVNKIAFLPQLLTVVWYGWKYYDRLLLACFLQTFAFVTFNKVCTSQYFIWYIGLFPLAYPFMRMPLQKSVELLFMWIGSQGIWLLLAYLLEFRNYDIAFYVWLASCLFLVTNLVLMYNFTKYADETEPRKSTSELVVKRQSFKKSQ